MISTGTLALSYRNLSRQKTRTGAALATLVAGIVAYLIAGGFIEWIFESMRESTIRSQLGHVQITRPGYFAGGISDPYNNLLPPDHSPVAASDGARIRMVGPRLSFNGLLSAGESTISFVGEGVVPEAESLMSDALQIVSGENLPAARPDTVIMGEGLAANLGVKVGDRVALVVSTATGGVNAVELELVGLFGTMIKAYDDTALRVHIDVARNLMRVEGATSWVVLLHQTSDTAAVVELLRSRLDKAGFEVIPWYDLADFYNKTVELFSKQIGVVRFLIAVIIVLSIFNTLSMNVIERTGEIGTSLAIGVRRRGILIQFLTEAGMLGIAGGVLGLVVGYALAALISAIGIPMPPPPGASRGYIGAINITPQLALDAVLLACLTTLAASAVPAWKASRMNIVDALRLQR